MLTTNIEALRGLYVALGGDVADVADITTLPEMLTQISTVAAAAASELPAVTTSDNGKIMQVKSGKWAAGLKFPTSITSTQKFRPICVNGQGTDIVVGSAVQYLQSTIKKSGSSYSFEQFNGNYAAVKDFVNGKINVGINFMGNSFAEGCSVYYAGNDTLNDQDAIFSGVVVDNGDVYALIITVKSDDTKTISVTKLSA